MFRRTLENISERELLGKALLLFKPPVRISTMDWARSRRIISSKETSFGVGNFEPNHTPYMEYVYECLDNPFIPTIVSQKSARIAWTETLNNYRGNRIENNPCQMMLGFPTGGATKNFAKFKWADFLNGVPALKNIINVGVARNKESMFDYAFPNGVLRLVTLGAITNQKSDNFPYIEIEEPDDAKDDVSGQGDTLDNLKQRQKTIPVTMKKLIFGGTPTNKDFSRVEKAIRASNYMVFKAQCHECGELIPMDGTSFACIHIDEYLDNRIDDRYGKFDPDSAKFFCPCCDTEWTFAQKNLNIIAGKQFGFTDHTGNFSKGWHPKNPQIMDVFGFAFSELMSPFPASSFIEMSKQFILAELDKAKGDERKMKSYFNNCRGLPYASGFSAMEVEDMQKLRINYPEHIVPPEASILTCGIDVQHNRFAITTLGWGRNGCVWLVTWKEIFGNVLNRDDPVWKELTEYCTSLIPHAFGASLPITAISIDSGDGGTTELVYSWVRMMNNLPQFNGQVRATKGVRELRFSQDEIFAMPREINPVNQLDVARSVAETMGVKVFPLGAHKAHDEILRRIALNQIENCKTDVFYFNEQSYGKFEEQMLSCRKIVDTSKNYTKMYYQLISGKRKEAMDACKNAFHAAYAIGIREFTLANWEALEKPLLPKQYS